jgi:hypothetical protein
MDSRRAPERIGLSHLCDESPELAAYARAARCRASGESGPVLAEAAALLGDTMTRACLQPAHTLDNAT